MGRKPVETYVNSNDIRGLHQASQQWLHPPYHHWWYAVSYRSKICAWDQASHQEARGNLCKWEGNTGTAPGVLTVVTPLLSPLVACQCIWAHDPPPLAYRGFGKRILLSSSISENRYKNPFAEIVSISTSRGSRKTLRFERISQENHFCKVFRKSSQKSWE